MTKLVECSPTFHSACLHPAHSSSSVPYPQFSVIHASAAMPTARKDRSADGESRR
jgi:hypothetical protein